MSGNGMVRPRSCPTGVVGWASIKRSTAMSNKSIATMATMGIDIGNVARSRCGRITPPEMPGPRQRATDGRADRGGVIRVQESLAHT
jgi:hypothetical protein